MTTEKITKINVSLYENHLTPEKDDYFAKVQSNGTLTNETIARQIVAQRSEFRYDTILNILNVSDEIKRDYLSNGYSVVDGVSQMRPVVSGRFMGKGAQFDSVAHSLHVSMSPSPAMRKTIASSKVIVHGVAPTGPVINRVYDMFSGTENDTITPGCGLKIEGQRLRIAGEDVSVIGVWFINASDPDQRTRVEEHQLLDNSPSNLMVNVPQLAQGQYILETVTQSSSNNKDFSKTPRTCRFEIILSVV